MLPGQTGAGWGNLDRDVYVESRIAPVVLIIQLLSNINLHHGWCVVPINLSLIIFGVKIYELMSACIKQTAASHPKFDFTLTFIFCSPICSYNCSVVFLYKYISFREIIFSFDRSNMQIFTVNITRVV